MNVCKKHKIAFVACVLLAVSIVYFSIPLQKVPLTLLKYSLKDFTIFSNSGFNDRENWSTLELNKMFNNNELGGYIGMAFDGRFVYLSPDFNGAKNKWAVRYDTTKDFEDKSSWAIFDLQHVTDKFGFAGMGFSGHYVYYSPYGNGKILRFDTLKNFTDSNAWETFESKFENFWGKISSDGKHIYFSPINHSHIIRYDTTKDFKNENSWEEFDAKVLTNKTGYYGNNFDGKFTYFIPRQDQNGSYHGQIIRYDTTKNFKDKSSWELFDIAKITEKIGYLSSVFDEKYLYLIPYRNNTEFSGTVMRYDTTKDFESESSWEFFSLGKNNIGYNPRGFLGGGFDGRFVYLSPFYNGKGYHGEIVRYDTLKDFKDKNSWESFYPKMNFVGNNPVGYGGVIFTGKELIFAPYYNNKEFHSEVLMYKIVR